MLSGAALRRLRLRAGRSQEEVSRLVGIPASVLSAYERGNRQPGLEVVDRIVTALGFRVEFVPALDPEVQAKKLVDVLGLAEALPYRARPLRTPNWGPNQPDGWASTAGQRPTQRRRPRRGATS